VRTAARYRWKVRASTYDRYRAESRNGMPPLSWGDLR
jgi:hypothetical protein